MEKEFARTFGFEVGAVAVAVGGDVKGVEPSFTMLNLTISVGEITSTRAEGLNFSAGENDAGLDGVGDGIIKTGFPVLDLNGFQGT